MTRFTPTAEQLERLDDIRVAVVHDRQDTHEDRCKLAALLGLPKPKPQPKALPWKSFPYPERPDEDLASVEGVDYTDETDTADGVFVGRKYTDDYIKRRDEYEDQCDARYKAAMEKREADEKAYDERREAADAAREKWKEDNAALLEAMSDWEDYFWRLDNPKEAAERDAENAREQREEIFNGLLGLKRFLKQPVAESTIGDLVADAYSEWSSLAEETRTNADNMSDSFPSKADEWGELADTLENFTQPEVPDKFKDVTIAFYVGRYGSGKDARNSQAIDDVQTVIDYLEELEGDEDAEALASDLEDTKGEAEGLSFPGWGG